MSARGEKSFGPMTATPRWRPGSWTQEKKDGGSGLSCDALADALEKASRLKRLPHDGLQLPVFRNEMAVAQGQRLAALFFIGNVPGVRSGSSVSRAGTSQRRERHRFTTCVTK